MPITVETSGNLIVCSRVAGMNIHGDASFNTLQQQSVRIENIDYEFVQTLDASAAVNFLKCFTVTGNGPNYGFNVAIGDAATLHSILQTSIETATHALEGASAPESDISGAVTCEIQMKNDLWNSLSTALGLDELNNTAEDTNIAGLNVALEASGGAWNMVNELSANQFDLNALYTQIPTETLTLYMDGSENSTTPYLPLKGGDKITFVYDIAYDSSGVVTVSKDEKLPDAASAPVVAETEATVSDVSGKYENSVALSNFDASGLNKRVAFTMVMGGNGVLYDLVTS